MRAVNCPEHHSTELNEFFQGTGSTIKIAPGETIAHQGAPLDTVYRILRGCVRTSFYSEDGDRKLLQFLGPDDFLGLSDAAFWPTSQEAVDMVVLQAIPRRLFEAELLESPALQCAVRHELVRKIDAHASLLVLTAQTTAVDRVRMFLHNFAARRASTGFIALPMGRRDIADHLGLSMETVSRAFSTLKAQGEIALRGASFFRLLTPELDRGIPRAA